MMMGSYLRIKGVRLNAICDKYESLVKQLYDAVGDVNLGCYTDSRKMLCEADIEAVVIAVAPEHNAELVCEALNAGKHVLCEVPLTYTIEDCWRVVIAVEKSGLKFQMSEQARYAPYIQAWKKMVSKGRLGKILFVEGQYFHGMGQDRYWQDRETGARLTIEQAENNPRAVKSRFWAMSHPILYLPHELSPILSVLDDRVTRVSCVATRRPSYYHEWFPVPDLEASLMCTEKGAILRLATAFVAPTATPNHWYHFMGTNGRVETNRYEGEKMKIWTPDNNMGKPVEMNWEYDTASAPAEAIASGHGGMDYYPMATFVDSILNDVTPPMDVYKTAETTAPAILAAQSVDKDSQWQTVPDFRPGAKRAKGHMPES